MEEKRREPRWQINQEAGLVIEGGLKAIPCIVHDISPSGMRVSIKRNFFPEVFSNFDLDLCDGFICRLGGHVAWQGESGDRNIFGLSFSKAEDQSKEEISGYIRNRFREEIQKKWWDGII